MPRAFFHDYRSRCIYHITMTKAAGVPAFSTLAGGVDDAHVNLTLLGKMIVAAIFELPKREPAISNLQYVIMPDHIHLLIFIKEQTPKALGSYIGMLKVLAGQLYRDKTGINMTIFESDFYDCILHPSRKLNTIFSYIRANPYRLAVRLACPDFFTRLNNIVIGDTPCRAYGNLQLLDNPFKEQVIVHRADSAEQFAANKTRWLHIAANGGVLVSPFISLREKEVRAEAETLDGRFILITNKALAEREKPSAHDFNLCTSGRLLIVAPQKPLPLTRDTCLKMNAIARCIINQQLYLQSTNYH